MFNQTIVENDWWGVCIPHISPFAHTPQIRFCAYPTDPLLRIALWSVEVRKHISLHKRWRRDDFMEHVDEPPEKLCEIIDCVLEFSAFQTTFKVVHFLF